MSNAKHTPGPWKTAGKEKRLIIDSESNLICSTSYSMNDYEGTLPIAQANARLIAAAPELLAALEMVSDGPHDAEAIADMLPTIRAAMAKAKGE